MKNKIFLAIFMVCTKLWSLPLGLEILSGKVFFEESADGLKIYASDGAVLQWDQFSIGETESLVFAQPDQNASVWNLVGEHPSRLKGQLDATGHVFLINSHGILIGKGAEVRSAGFVASTLKRQGTGFREEKKGLVVNQGKIQADEVYLLGYEVQNWGEIAASKAGLLGTREVDLSNGKIKMEGFQEAVKKNSLERFDGLKALDMPGPAVIHQGNVTASEIYILGDYVDLRKDSILIGEEIFIGGGKEDLKSSRIIKMNGFIEAESIRAHSDAALQGRGEIKGRLEVHSPLLLDL